MRRSSISPRKHPNLRKELKLHFAMIEEVKLSKKVNKHIYPLAVVSGKIVDKYRLKRLMKTRLDISKRRAYKSNDKIYCANSKIFRCEYYYEYP